MADKQPPQDVRSASAGASDAAPAVCACVLIPTFNNVSTIGRVAREARAIVSDVIVVNDGSDDGTPEELRQIEGIRVLTNDRNLGKGVALSRGLAYALEQGFTHAIAMDGDGQHHAADLPQHLAALAAHPEAIVLGVRRLDRGRRAMKSRLLRFNSNFWVWAETGRWLRDTQSGFRTYPLAQVCAVRLKTRKYDFEIECLVKSMWLGTPVVCVDVSTTYEHTSPSHFRPLRDFALVSHINGCLMVQRLFLPLPLLRAMHARHGPERPRLRTILAGILLHESRTPASIATCLGLGAVIGILPIWGFQTVAAVGVAHRLRLSKPLMVAGSHVSFPAAIPFILGLSLAVGHLLVSGSWPGIPSPAAISHAIARSAAEYILGATAVSIAAGLLVGGVSYVLARLASVARRKLTS